MSPDMLFLVKAFFLGIIEGLTEFLPISSTGHLILIGKWIDFDSGTGKVFEVIIQLGAILAVVWIYRAKIARLIAGVVARDPASLRFAGQVCLAFLPAAVIGALAIGYIKAVLFQPAVVAATLVIGGLIILWVERQPTPHAVEGPQVERMTWGQALAVGIAQCVAMIPGTSRSGATIVGGMLAGLNRQTATEFSFFLAMPTMLGAAVYDGWKHRAMLGSHDMVAIGVGFIAAFLSAMLVVKALVRFVASHSLNVFAWYRIALGLAIAVVLFVA
jgi:undecaprenyl-diphosphatase